MNYKFRIPYDDQVKIEPIFEKFGQEPFTRAGVIAEKGLPHITSGDIVRWEGHGMIECLGREMKNPDLDHPPLSAPYVWRITDRTVYALTKKQNVSKAAQ
jgi:hypothetical protein